MATAKKKAPSPALADMMKILSGDIAPSADASALLRGVMKHVGGVDELARIFAQALKGSEPGSQNQTRLLDTLQRLIIMNTQHDLARRVEPSRMTTDDLHRTAAQLFTKFGFSHGTPGADKEIPGA